MQLPSSSFSRKTKRAGFPAMLIAGLLAGVLLIPACRSMRSGPVTALEKGFRTPPDSAKPGVYWYFMDGNMTEASMTADLESMKKAGIGNLVFLEVNVGVPRGQVDFLSEAWQKLFAHAVSEAERLGIEITLGVGPGWTGSGGPWVKPEASMQHLVASTVRVSGGAKTIVLPLPPPHKPFFGEGNFTPELRRQWTGFYRDVAVLAFPTPAGQEKIADIDEKALYDRAPYSSAAGVKPHLPYASTYPEARSSAVPQQAIIDLSDRLKPDGTLSWTPPAGNWTIMRFVSRNNGAVTRPAPFPGLGFEADKFDTVALREHLDHYVGKLLVKTGRPAKDQAGGLRRLHMDSWEMGAQNWTATFREAFKKRRGYDPLPFYPVYTGQIVGSREISERFLWDLRQTGQELVLEQHAGALKKYAANNNMQLSIEPYDMNPTADLELGAIADVPMAEFWSKGYGFNSSFSVTEASSIGHVNGRSLIPAEAFTAQNDEGWKQYPGAMKNQGDWAFASGINRFVYHTFQNQFLPDSLRPGATMGPYGVHWDRNQTWWPMVGAYHDYISRCQFMLQQGTAVADILYLAPEGSPHVFRAPADAMNGDTIPDRKAYNFDGCAPSQLYKAVVENGQISFPGGARYRLLVLPAVKTMTPTLLKKIRELVAAGATVIGEAPEKAPGLSNYPACDTEVGTIARGLFGRAAPSSVITLRRYGKGRICSGGALSQDISHLYPRYAPTADLLRSLHITADFVSALPVRYTHRRSDRWDMYFVSNTRDEKIRGENSFRSTRGAPKRWDPITGTLHDLPEYSVSGETTRIPLTFEPFQSYFIVFEQGVKASKSAGRNFPDQQTAFTLDGSWNVSFDPKWGGPEHVLFPKLTDWILRPEKGIRYYSGSAVYRKNFDLPAHARRRNTQQYILDLGAVKNLARVKLNGRDLGVLWTAPWQLDISSALKKTNNQLEIEVINLWPNRLIGDEEFEDDGIKDGKWPDWLLRGAPRPGRRYTFSTHRFYTKNSPLLSSGLLGPVRIQTANR